MRRTIAALAGAGMLAFAGAIQLQPALAVSVPAVITAAPNTQVTAVLAIPGCSSCEKITVVGRAQLGNPSQAQSLQATQALQAAQSHPQNGTPPSASTLAQYQIVSQKTVSLASATTSSVKAKAHTAAAFNYWYPSISVSESGLNWSETTYVYNMWFNYVQSWHGANAYIDPYHSWTFLASLNVNGDWFVGWQPATAGTGQYAGAHTAFSVSAVVSGGPISASHWEEIRVYPNGYVTYPVG